MSIGPPIPQIQHLQNLTLKIKGQGQMTLMLHNYRSRQFHRTSNGINPSSGSKDMGSAKSGPSAAWFDKFLADGQTRVGQITMTVHNYRSRQVHETLNGVNPSSGFRDMRSAKSGSNLWQIWQVFGPWASPYGANGQMSMTVHNYRPRQFHRTSNGENPSSGYRDMGSASLAAARPTARPPARQSARPPARPPARTVTTIPLQPGGLRGKNESAIDTISPRPIKPDSHEAHHYHYCLLRKLPPVSFISCHQDVEETHHHVNVHDCRPVSTQQGLMLRLRFQGPLSLKIASFGIVITMHKYQWNALTSHKSSTKPASRNRLNIH